MKKIWILVVVLAVGLLVFAGLFFYQQRGETIRVSPEEKRITEKLAAGQRLTSKEREQYEAMIQEGIRQYKELEKGQKEAAVPPPPPPATAKEWPIKKTWKFPTFYGALTITYRETDSAKGKIRFWVENRRPNEFQVYAQNLLDRPIKLTIFGKVNGEVKRLEGEFRANEKDSIGVFNSPARVEYWLEVE